MNKIQLSNYNNINREKKFQDNGQNFGVTFLKSKQLNNKRNTVKHSSDTKQIIEPIGEINESVSSAKRSIKQKISRQSSLKYYPGLNKLLSFGKKIPIAKCQIYDKLEDKFIPAQIFELDCSDDTDIEYLRKKIKGPFGYTKFIISDMKEKSLFQNFYKVYDDVRFYILENKKNGILGFTEFTDHNNTLTVKWLEARRDKQFKYVGQSLISSITMKMLKGNYFHLKVSNPTRDAFEFYSDKCGFDTENKSLFDMNREKASEFIKNVQKKLGLSYLK